MRKNVFRLTVFAATLVLAGGAAQAHKLKVFASATGTVIEGYAYFSPGGKAHQATVTVTAQDGTVLDKATTDDEGAFHFEAKRRIDHTITVDGGDGHVSSYTVAASELPDSLPGGDGQAPASPSNAPQAPASATNSALLDDAGLRTFIDQSVSRQIRPLREQIDAYQEKIWWHDVLGGIGYILGLGGLAFGFSERRKRENDLKSAVLKKAAP